MTICGGFCSLILPVTPESGILLGAAHTKKPVANSSY